MLGRGIFTKHGSQWCPTKEIWVKQGGVWCPVKKVYVKVEGQWCLCFPPGGFCSYNLSEFLRDFTIGYSGGLTPTESPSCLIFHQQMHADYETTNIEVFDTDGNYIKTACESTGWPQCVRKIEDRIWFSYTEAEYAGFYSIPWDETLQIYPATARDEVIIDYNWDVKQSPDGKIFICGAEGMWGEHKISYVDGNNTIPIIEIGGNSCGFDFDNEGNLWAGEYVLGFSPSMHIEPCRIGMWTKEAIDSALAGATLDWSDASVVIGLGALTIEDQSCNWGPNDIEADSQGNIYVSMNTYSSWGDSSEYGRIVKYYPDGEGGYAMDVIWEAEQRINKWDWVRNLAIDGSNLLTHLDMTQCNDIDRCEVIQI